jgi:hypothetical protein
MLKSGLELACFKAHSFDLATYIYPAACLVHNKA